MPSEGKRFGRRSFLAKGASAAGLGLFADLEAYPQNVNRNSNPSDLKITDMRIAVLSQGGAAGRRGASRGGARGRAAADVRPEEPPVPGPATPRGRGMGQILVRLDTNQGISGYGEMYNGGEPPYALILKSRILGENPCHVEKIFRKIKQFGGQARQGGGVTAVEQACWDLAGKAYGVPVHQMLGGAYRDKVRMYTETPVRSDDPKVIGADLRARVDEGFTMVKMDLGVEAILRGKPGTIHAPTGGPWGGSEMVEQFYTAYELTDKGCELVADYVGAVREAMGCDVPMAHDHFGHLGINSLIKLGKALQKYSPAWLEDMVPWFRTQEWKTITDSIDVPTLTGEDVYLAESFEELCQARAVDYIHPDPAVTGGCLELKKMGDLAQRYSIGMMVHCASTPIGYMAGVHAIAATENFIACEWHQPERAWYKDITDMWPIVKDGYIEVPMKPGMGIEVNEEAIRPLCREGESFNDPTTQWDTLNGQDRLWS
jgi:L-alanine-DL-glutamate epimerase-like enolase superfamily enzyme